MFCPKCSQQQASDEVRFCPRCGLQLDAVQALLADGRGAAAEGLQQTRVARAGKRDVVLGATVMLVGAIAVALLTVSTVSGTPLQAVVIPLLLLWAALVSVLLLSGHAVREVSKLFSKDAHAPDASASLPAASSDLTTRVGAAARRHALPPTQSTPAFTPGAWRADTAELAQPASVTERTTDLLGRK
jgi:hypothetical protein